MTEGDSPDIWQQVAKLALSIIAIVGIVIVPGLPLRAVRPNVAPPVENRFVSAQNVDARLWQDPFEAVDADRERRRELRPAGSQERAATELDATRNTVSQMRSEFARISGQSEAPPLVLLVFVPGGPYPENGESRRRTRYATLSGLRAAGLTPVDAEHVGYFEAGAAGLRAGLPILIVYEWLKVIPPKRHARLDHVLLVWIDERVFGNSTARKTAALLKELGACDVDGRRGRVRTVMLGPAESGSVRHLVEDAERVSAGDRKCVSPTFVLSTATLPDYHLIPGAQPDGPGLPGAVKDRTKTSNMGERLAKSGLHFTRMLPTDDKLTDELIQELKARDLEIERPPDGHTTGARLARVVVVSEWDTLYGRRAVELLSWKMCQQGRGVAHQLTTHPDDVWCGGGIQLFEYQRGLDGVIPGHEVKKSGDRSEKPSGWPWQHDTDAGERAEGTPQLDYLRRFAAELDRRLSSAAARSAGWKDDKSLVVAVVGSDTYDKLLILQALRAQHPQATFVTFDLDARMLHRDEFNWVRNLIVISALGLRLRPELQGSIPPFRDAYQTAYFLSARAAIDHANSETMAPATSFFHPTWRPRVFEIGRGEEFDLSVDGGQGTCSTTLACADVTPPRPNRLSVSRRELWWLAVAGVVVIGVTTFSTAARRALGRSLRGWLGRLAWTVGLACLGAGAVLLWSDGIAALVTERVLAVAPRLAEDRPEPFSWTGGVSMWPTEIIRAAVFFMVLVFSVVAARAVRVSTTKMTRRYCLGVGKIGQAPAGSGANGNGASPNGARNALTAHPVGTAATNWLARARDAVTAVGNWVVQAGDAVTLSSLDRITRCRPIDSARLWAEYRRQNHGWRMFVRVFSSGVLAFVLAYFVMRYFGFPHLPARGTVILWVDFKLLFYFCVPAVLWLQMYVVDVIRLCEKVTSGLAAERPTSWPSATRLQFWPSHAASLLTNGGEKLRAPVLASSSPHTAGAVVAVRPLVETIDSPAADEDVAYWLDIRFTAEWTSRVSWLVYLPFVAICLMMIARSRFFDAWDTPPGLYIGFGLSLAYMVICVGVLMYRATTLRRNALWQLQRRARRLIGSPSAAAELDRAKHMIEDVERTDQGAFAPLTRQPIFGALAVLFGGAGITAVAQYLLGIQ